MSQPYAMILAGGSGTRFWPLSRNSRPKQLLELLDSGTLLSQTIHRLEGLIPRENILILTNAAQEDAVRHLASSVPPENIFAEPARRDTAPAVALGVGLVAARDPEATMMILPSDQLIMDTAAFQSVMKDAIATASLGGGPRHGGNQAYLALSVLRIYRTWGGRAPGGRGTDSSPP